MNEIPIIDEWYPVCLDSGQCAIGGMHTGKRQVIRTSAIVRVRHDTVETKSGSFYRLGRMDPEVRRIFPGADTAAKAIAMCFGAAEDRHAYKKGRY